jgi:hypothetical protein
MDRQDIDALLIGALYGELTPADEARLAAHLDSHPADKTALDDLKAARESVKASRIFELQTEPPQAISAVLLQEAARRAPRRGAAPDGERESWFHRFVRSFAAHPAMAAAAMLVVVVGVAGTLYMKNGDQFAEKTASAPEQVATDTTSTDNGIAAGPVADAGAAAYGKDEAQTGGAATGSAAAAYDVALAERPQVATNKAAETPKPDRERLAQTEDEPKKQAVSHAAGKKGYIEVTTPQQMPKEMPPRNADKEEKLDDGDFAKAPTGNSSALGGEAGATRGASAGGGAPGGAPASVTASASPPPPPADYKTAPAKPQAPPSKTVAKVPAPAPQEQAPVEAQPGTDTTLIAWAKAQHKKAVELVRANNCAGAAQIAVTVRNRAYGYFTQNMQNDRDLKGCQTYISDAVNRDEERSSKPKAAKRASDEAAPSVK